MSRPAAPSRGVPPGVVCLGDYERLATAHLTREACAWLYGGAGDESTVRENCAAFQRLRLRGRVLRTLSGGHARVSLFGREFEHPILLAPVAHLRVLHPEGELAAALGAAAARAGMVLSAQAGFTIEAIAGAARGPRWLQLDLHGDLQRARELARRAEAAGYEALVVTVDAPVSGVRDRERRAGFVIPAGVEAVNLRGAHVPAVRPAAVGESAVFGSGLADAAPDRETLAAFIGDVRLPVLVKGILHPEDAVEVIESGAAGIVVSNHGGRVLDTAVASIEALPAVAGAVGGRVPVLLDGGVRRGTDVLKALALGASAVLIGRPYAQALAVAGATGVAHVIHMLRAEFEAAMALTGCRTPADIDASVIYDPLRSGTRSP